MGHTSVCCTCLSWSLVPGTTRTDPPPPCAQIRCMIRQWCAILLFLVPCWSETPLADYALLSSPSLFNYTRRGTDCEGSVTQPSKPKYIPRARCHLPDPAGNASGAAAPPTIPIPPYPWGTPWRPTTASRWHAPRCRRSMKWGNGNFVGAGGCGLPPPPICPHFRSVPPNAMAHGCGTLPM